MTIGIRSKIESDGILFLQKIAIFSKFCLYLVIWVVHSILYARTLAPAAAAFMAWLGVNPIGARTRTP